MLDKESRKAVSGYTKSVGGFFGRAFSPNQMTVITLLLGVVAAVAVFYGYFFLAIVLFLLSGLSDWVDGAIAKATNRVTEFGGALDSIVDKITELAVYIALALVEPVLAVPAMLAATMMMWSSYANQRCKAIGLEKGRGFMQRKERAFLLMVLLLDLGFNNCPVGQWSCTPTNLSVGILYIIAILSFLTGAQRVYLTYKSTKKGGV
jgi:CDP-diacylglycerol--glycerol-3-phosphate 3-phosphatidyltransferase